MAKKRRRRRARDRARAPASASAAGAQTDADADAGPSPAARAPEPGPPTGDRPSRGAYLAVLGAVVLAAAVYGPTLDHAFQFDDEWKILDNPLLRKPSVYFEHFGTGGYSERSTRLVPNMTFVLNYALFGYESFGWHLTNLLLHLINVVLVAAFGWALASRMGGVSARGVALGATLFAVHPLNSEAVNYCNARPSVIVTTFYLGTLLAMLRAVSSEARGTPRAVAWWVATALCLVLALLSKELAVTVCLMAPLTLAWLWFGTDGREGVAASRMGPIAAALACAGLATVFITGAHVEIARVIFRQGASETGHWASYQLVTLLGQSEVFIRYLGLALLPLPRFLLLDRRAMGHLYEHVYDDGEVTNASLATLGLPVLSAVVLVTTLILLFRFRRRAPMITLLGLWPFITHAPTSVVPRGEVMVEYRSYLPMVGVCLLLGLGVERLVVWLARRMGDESPAALLRVVAVGLSIMACAGTAVRNQVWADPRRMWEDILEKSPKNPRAYNSLGMLEMAQGKRESAMKLFARSIELSPTYGVAHGNLGGMLAQDGHMEAAEKHLRLATEYPPANPEAHNNLANVLLQEGAFDEAIEHYDKALALNPTMGEAMANKGRAYEHRGDLDRAMELYRQAIETDPDFAGSYYRLGGLFLQRGEVERGMALFRKSLSMDPRNAQAHLRLGVALFGQSKHAEAARHLEQALKLQPNLSQARQYLQAIRQR